MTERDYRLLLSEMLAALADRIRAHCEQYTGEAGAGGPGDHP